MRKSSGTADQEPVGCGAECFHYLPSSTSGKGPSQLSYGQQGASQDILFIEYLFCTPHKSMLEQEEIRN